MIIIIINIKNFNGNIIDRDGADKKNSQRKEASKKLKKNIYKGGKIRGRIGGKTKKSEWHTQLLHVFMCV
jgi:hypothetical protein